MIADAKVVTAFNATHMAQMLGYLNISGLDLAVLLNFKEATLKWKRIINDLKSQSAILADSQENSEIEPRMGTDEHE